MASGFVGDAPSRATSPQDHLEMGEEWEHWQELLREVHDGSPWSPQAGAGEEDGPRLYLRPEAFEDRHHGPGSDYSAGSGDTELTFGCDLFADGEFEEWLPDQY